MFGKKTTPVKRVIESSNGFVLGQRVQHKIDAKPLVISHFMDDEDDPTRPMALCVWGSALGMQGDFSVYEIETAIVAPTPAVDAVGLSVE